MAVVLSHLRFLLTQRELFPVGVPGGRVLCLGVQDVHATHAELEQTLRQAGIEPVVIPPEQRSFTESQVVPRERRCAHIRDLFRMLGYDQVETLDFSEAERPDRIHDLNEPFPAAWRMENRYDLVFDIGVVEHVCDIYQALKNCISLVKPGGSIMHIVPLHGWHNMVFFNFQPMYFMEVYGANGFDQQRMFINYYPQYNEWRDRPQLYREYCYGDEMIFQEPRKFTNLCFFARKTRTVSPPVKPLQGFYLRYHGAQASRESAGSVSADAGGGTREAEPAVSGNGTSGSASLDEGAQLDGRWAARLKRGLPLGLREPLLKLNRFRLRLEEVLLPEWLCERLWCWRRQRFLRALDRARQRTILRI